MPSLEELVNDTPPASPSPNLPHSPLSRRQFVSSATALTALLSVCGVGCARAALPVEGTNAVLGEPNATMPEEKPAPTNAAPATRPNVLLILADDLGWSDLGCYGGEIDTPQLDALAKEGLRYTQFYNSARCCPSRAALLTGVNPHQAGFPDMSGTLPDNVVTLPEVLKTTGYNTYMVGKWHLGNQKTPTMRGFDEFYGMIGGFNSYWEEHPNFTRLPDGHAKIDYNPGEFYSTNAFGDYALQFLKQNETDATKKPWFMYLAFNAPHFPLGAPEDAIAKYEGLYNEKGWDAIRADRLAKMKTLGIVPADLTLTPREPIPANRFNEKTGWANKPVPAWKSLPADRRADLARRMAVYAAAVDIMDQNIGRVVEYLKESKQWDNTLLLFLSDNGACAEWDAYGFDKLDSTLNILHKGDDLKKVGGPNSYISYGAGWANACDTPWRLYKHYAEEGGIRTPLIAHWPDGLKIKPGATTPALGFLTDFMPTLVDLSGATYPKERNGVPILPTEGFSLAPTFAGKPGRRDALFVEHEGNRMVREADWKLVAQNNKPWELYDLAKDPTEMHDVSAKEAARVKKMEEAWSAWAVRCNVVSKPSPHIANRSLIIRCDVSAPSANETGVLVAQGGNQQGYALHLKDGKPVWSVRENGKLTEIIAPAAASGRFSLEARLNDTGAMTLAINQKIVAQGKASGRIPVQPKDELSTGEDTLSAVGNYAPPNRFKGKVENVTIDNGDPDGSD